MARDEDLLRIAKKLDKMVSRNNTDGAVDLLKELRGFNMTVKLLQETRIGMSVNCIRKQSRDDEVIALAKVLIKDWKRLLESSSCQKLPAVKNGMELKTSPSSSPSDSRKDSFSKESNTQWDDGATDRKESPDLKPTLPKKSSVEVKKVKQRKDSTEVKAGKRLSTEQKPDRRESTDSKDGSQSAARKLSTERRESAGSSSRKSSCSDSSERKGKVDTPKSPTTPTSPMSPSFSPCAPLRPQLATGDSVRDKCIEMLAAALRTDDDFKVFGTNCESMAAEIEDYIYQEIKVTDMKYKNRVRSRISNLKDPKNPGLRKNVLAGTIELSRIAAMSSEEMASDELKQLRSTLTQEAIREHQMAKTGGTTTDLLQCGKCKKRNCTYNQVQTRSADEPMTTFVLCNECGNRWKFC